MLGMVLGRMVQINVRLKPSRCSFGMTSVEFLRHIFDEHGALKWQESAGNSRCSYPYVGFGHRFVGMINYFRDFIPSLSSYLVPLTDLTKKKQFR